MTEPPASAPAPEPALDDKLRCQIQRFIHTGNEIPKYYPGSWTSHKYFELNRLQAINTALQSNPNNVTVVAVIKQAYKDGWYTRFESIAFALAKCLLLGSPAVKEVVYKTANEICITPEELMIFNKFTRILKTGNGRGWCRHIKEWYLGKEPMELAREMTRVRSRCGRSHKTLIRKAHTKVPDQDYARDAVVKYAIYGLKRARQLVGDKEGTKEIFEHIQKVEDMRHCEDPVAAAAMAAKHQFTLDHVPCHLLTSQDVWNAILPQMSLEELLQNILRLHNMGFLGPDSTTLAIVLSLFNNQDLVKNAKITPLGVYIVLNDFKKKTKPMRPDKAKAADVRETRRRSRQTLDTKTGIWEWNVTRRHPKEVKHWGIDLPPNPAIIAALNKIMDQSWLLTKPTKVRYMITLDMRHHMFKGRHFCKTYVVPKKIKKAKETKAAIAAPGASGDADTEKKSKKHLLAECFFNKHTTPGHAAIILALQILKREKNVKLAVFNDEGVQIVTIERNFTNIEEAEFVLRKANLGRVQLDAPMVWAAKNKHKVDVFINMIDRTSRYMELEQNARGGRGPGGRYGPPPPEGKDIPDHCPVRALERYRQETDVKDAKLITMSLASHRITLTDGSHEGVLDIVGIDEHIPKIIDAFALGQFK